MITTETQETKTDFNNLTDQLLEKKQEKSISKNQEDSSEKSQEVTETPKAKKFVFKKGDQSFELDEDAEFEMMADKKPVKLTLRELKDRAAGDIAVKNRMHSLAEEKKKVQSTFKEFSKIAKDDPLGALEFISQRTKDSDNDFEYKTFLSALAEQAEKLAKMDENELKAYELQKKLTKAEQDLSLKDRQQNVVQMKRNLLESFPEIGDRQFDQMVNAVLDNEELSAGIETEEDLMSVVEDLIQETLTQRDVINLINDISPDYSGDNDLIFSLSDQLRQNPDLDEEDVRDIIRRVTRGTDRDKATRVLSQKQRYSTPVDQLKKQGANDFEILAQQLMERREQPKR